MSLKVQFLSFPPFNNVIMINISEEDFAKAINIANEIGVNTGHYVEMIYYPSTSPTISEGGFVTLEFIRSPSGIKEYIT